MPRKDRRFTADDIARLYCRNLSLPQKALARAVFEECEVEKPLGNESVARLLGLLANTLDDFGVPLVPIALSLLADAVLSADEQRVREIIDQMGLPGDPSA